jgi:hypothetical protein
MTNPSIAKVTTAKGSRTEVDCHSPTKSLTVLPTAKGLRSTRGPRGVRPATTTESMGMARSLVADARVSRRSRSSPAMLTSPTTMPTLQRPWEEAQSQVMGTSHQRGLKSKAVRHQAPTATARKTRPTS